MAYENIKLRKQNVAVVDGYFYMMDDDVDALIVKTDDGTQAFSYPLSNTITNTITSLEHDGRNFWSLETSATNEVTIRRWYVNNYVCKLRNTFTLSPGGSHNYVSGAMTVEHYHRTFTGDEAAGQSILSMDSTNMANGETLTLGPNSSGQVEEVVVNTTAAGSVTIYGSTTYAYSTGDPVSFYKDIWLFNDYDGTTAAAGALYKIDGYTGAYTTHSGGGEFYNIDACTFYDMSYVDASWDNAICYVRGTNMIFLNPQDLNDNFGSMVMDNLHENLSDTLLIYDVAIEGANVYRLQRQATYYGTTTTFADSTYNYQLSTLDAFITSISLRAAPAILPANGVNEADITAVVKDQFNQPIVSKLVDFTDDDANGYITAPSVNTDGQGVAETKYHAGTTAREVKITATAQQS
jgi:hypothetical protein